MQLFGFSGLHYCFIFFHILHFFMYYLPIFPQNYLIKLKRSSQQRHTHQIIIHFCFVLLFFVFPKERSLLEISALLYVSGLVDLLACGTALLLRTPFSFSENLFLVFYVSCSVSCALCLSLSGFTFSLKWRTSSSNLLKKEACMVQLPNLI